MIEIIIEEGKLCIYAKDKMLDKKVQLDIKDVTTLVKLLANDIY